MDSERRTGVISGRDLHETQHASSQEIIFVPTAHFLLVQADYNTLVGHSSRPRQWLGPVRGAFLGSLIACASVAGGISDWQSLSWVTVPRRVKVGFIIFATVGIFLAVVEVWARCANDPRREVMARIGATWKKPK